jgi:uncharacterized membrane protein
MASNYTIPVREQRPTVTARADAETAVLDRPFRAIFNLAVACFIGALISDIVYARAPDFIWAIFSIWLITVGLLISAAAALVGLIDRIVHRHFGTLASRWPYLVGIVAAVVVEIFNAFVHSRDAYLSVVPDGITLSAVAVVLLLLTPIVGRALSNNRTRKAL